MYHPKQTLVETSASQIPASVSSGRHGAWPFLLFQKAEASQVSYSNFAAGMGENGQGEEVFGKECSVVEHFRKRTSNQ